MKISFTILLLILNNKLFAQVTKPERGHYVREVVIELDTLFFDSLPIFIETNGTVSLISNSDIITFDLATNIFVESAYLFQSDYILYVFYEETDMLSGTSYLEAHDLKKLAPIYKTHIPGFNLSQPVIKNQQAYVSSFGFVGKVDLLTGDYLWKFEDLYDYNTYDFNNFAAAEFENGQVSFRSHNTVKNSIRTIIVDDLTGKRIE